jgi:chaperonin GroEL
MVKKIIYGEEAKNALKRGIDTVANCVKITLGAKGRNVAIDKQFGSPLITNDGVTIARDVELADEFENMGAKLVCETSSTTNTVAGDGTTTAIVLTQALVNEGLRSIGSGANPVFVKNGMQKAVDKVVEYIAEQAQPISGTNDIARIATVSSRSDEFGNIIAEVMDKVGNDGVITVEESQTGKTTYEIVEGLSFNRGYVTPYMATDMDKMEAVLDNPYILITDQKINNVQDVLPILESVVRTGKGLLIISDDMSNEVLTTLVTNKLRGTLNVVCVKAPAFAEKREDWLEDIAVVTNGRFISSKLGYELKNVNLEDLGVAKQVKVNKETTTIIDGYGDNETVTKRINNIKTQLKTETDSYEKEKLQERLAKLTNGIAVIKVGATTEAEAKDKKLRLEDALSATKSAVEEGIVAGGGITLLNAKSVLETISNDFTGDEKIGVDIVAKAIQYPIKQIVKNAGYEGSVVINEIERIGKSNYGFDVYTEQYVDMIKNGIIDPAKVTRTALQNAVSIATLVLTTEVLIADDREELEKLQLNNQVM